MRRLMRWIGRMAAGKITNEIKAKSQSVQNM